MTGSDDLCAREGCGKERREHQHGGRAAGCRFVESREDALARRARYQVSVRLATLRASAPQPAPSGEDRGDSPDGRCQKCGGLIGDDESAERCTCVVWKDGAELPAPQPAPGSFEKCPAGFKECVSFYVNPETGQLYPCDHNTRDPRPAPGGAVSFCPHGTPVCAGCLGNVNEDDEPAPSGDDCEACEEDSSFRCDVCGVEFCGEHAAQHKHAPSGDEAKVWEIVERWDATLPGIVRGGPHGIGTLLPAVREAYAAGKADVARDKPTIDRLRDKIDRLQEQIANLIARRGSEG